MTLTERITALEREMKEVRRILSDVIERLNNHRDLLIDFRDFHKWGTRSGLTEDGRHCRAYRTYASVEVK